MKKLFLAYCHKWQFEGWVSRDTMRLMYRWNVIIDYEFGVMNCLRPQCYTSLSYQNFVSTWERNWSELREVHIGFCVVIQYITRLGHHAFYGGIVFDNHIQINFYSIHFKNYNFSWKEGDGLDTFVKKGVGHKSWIWIWVKSPFVLRGCQII